MQIRFWAELFRVTIYGWRGAEVRNILEFDKVFENVKEIKLEGNYRSGKSILSIANRLLPITLCGIFAIFNALSKFND